MKRIVRAQHYIVSENDELRNWRQMIFWKCQNAYSNNVKRDTALHWIIKWTLAKYMLCKVPGSQDNRGKLASLKIPLKKIHTHTDRDSWHYYRQTDQQRFLALLERCPFNLHT